MSCHRVSLVATLSNGALATAKQKHFSLQKTDRGEYEQVLSTVLDELLDWKYKKELQLGPIHRHAWNKSGVMEKEPATIKTVPTMIAHSGRALNARSMGLTEVLTGSNPTGRLLSVQVAEDEINPIIAVRRDIRARWNVTRRTVTVRTTLNRPAISNTQVGIIPLCLRI